MQHIDPNAVAGIGGMQPGATPFPPMDATAAQPAAGGSTAPFPPAQPAGAQPAAEGSADDLPF